MVQEKDICVLTALLHEAGCSDVALAMEMALFGDDPTLDEVIHDFTATASTDIPVQRGAGVVFGSMSLDVQRISSEHKAQYKAIASKLLGNSSTAVRSAARNLLKAVG